MAASLLAHVAEGATSPWSFQLHLDVTAFCVALIGIYFLLLRAFRGRLPTGKAAATRRQILWWLLGVLSIYIASGWPLDTLADDYLFSAHMFQHMIYVFVAAPLLLLGFPSWLLRIASRRRLPAMVLRLYSRPWFALAYFNFMIVFIHWPPVVNEQVASEPFHFFIHAMILTAGVAMWWPVITPLPELSRLSAPAKMLYLFIQSIIPTVPASFLTFGSHPLYQAYVDAPRYFGIGPGTDQMIAGLTMKLLGGLLLWIVIAVLFFRWYQREEQGTAQLSWDDFEQELEAWDMRK